MNVYTNLYLLIFVRFPRNSNMMSCTIPASVPSIILYFQYKNNGCELQSNVSIKRKYFNLIMTFFRIMEYDLNEKNTLKATLPLIHFIGLSNIWVYRKFI